MIYYRQCVLEKVDGKATLKTVSYIPEKFAIVGKTLKLKSDDDVWEDGWVVMAAGDKTSEDLVPDTHKAIKVHRKATGDSSKKTISKE